MKLDVKARIALAMTIVLTMSVAAGAVSWWMHTRAARYSSLSQAATVRAQWVSGLSELLTVYVSEANDLAFGFGSDLSAEASAEYGDVIGVDHSIGQRLRVPPPGFDKGDVEETSATWEVLRVDVFVWINAEAEKAGSPIRLTLMDDGKVRASGSTNIVTPASLRAKTADELRREVRRELEAFKDRELRLLLRESESEANGASAQALKARTSAASASIALFLVNALVAAAMAVWLYRGIGRPLMAARLVADAVAQGDLEARFTRHSDDEVGSLIHAVEEMRDAVVSRMATMREMAGAVMVTAESVCGSLDEVREANGAGDPDELDAALDRASSHTRTLQGLSSQMLQG